MKYRPKTALKSGFIVVWPGYRPVISVSDVKTLATAALARDIRIPEAEGLVQAILHEIDLGTVD